MSVISPSTKVDNQKIAYGVHTTVSAVDVIDTGLAVVVAVVASMATDPNDDLQSVSAAPGTGASIGSITVKTWKNTSGTDPSPLAATTFSKVIYWIAVGY